jgi:hypothetical protein
MLLQVPQDVTLSLQNVTVITFSSLKEWQHHSLAQIVEMAVN